MNQKPIIFKPKSMNIKTATLYCGLAKSRIWELIKEGKLTISRPGKKTLIVTESLDRLIDANVVQEGI